MSLDVLLLLFPFLISTFLSDVFLIRLGKAGTGKHNFADSPLGTRSDQPFLTILSDTSMLTHKISLLSTSHMNEVFSTPAKRSLNETGVIS